MVFPKELQPWLYTSDPEQMVTILDALESVTNGMENPGLLERIKDISKESPLRPYVDLIFALQSYYRNDPQKVGQFLQSIPDNSPPSRLKPLISFLAGLTDSPPDGKVEQEIIRTILKRKSSLEIALEETELFLQKNQEESFSDSIAYLIRELYGKFPESSKQLTLWAWEKVHERSWQGSLLDDHLKMIFGEMEATRLKALYFLHSGQQGAFPTWSSFLMKLLLSEPSSVQVVEASLLVWIYAGMQEQADPDRVKDVFGVLEKKYPSLRAKYGKFLEDLTSSGIIRVSRKSGSRLSSAVPRQLELFPS